MDDSRKQRALEIADKFRIASQDACRWMVPSQYGTGRYSVTILGQNSHCTCLDWEKRRQPCKHVMAVELFRVNSERIGDAPKVTEAIYHTPRPTYKQDWTAYNAAQTNEKDEFQMLLWGLCQGLKQPKRTGRGRPALPISDSVFAAAFKVYSTVSGRRFMSDLRNAKASGFLNQLPHYNSIFDLMDNPGLTQILENLITESSLPLKSVERDFAVDSSGFSTCRFERWFDHKHGGDRFKRNWVKVHIMCGVKTNIVTAVEIRGREAHDAPLLPDMLESTAKNFTMHEVSADKGYLSVNNVKKIVGSGAAPFIALKTNSQPQTSSKVWNDMYYYFQLKRDEFLEHYHKRSNVETTFHMIKSKFRDSLRSKTDRALVNEALCKILCHNLVVLVHEAHELGVEPIFWAETPAARINA